MPRAKPKPRPDDEPEWNDDVLAWAGAILSTCTFYESGPKTLVLSKASADVHLLEMMAEKIRFGEVRGPYPSSPGHEGERDRWKWSLGRQDVVVPLLQDCWEWLSPTAQRKARKILGPKRLGLR